MKTILLFDPRFPDQRPQRLTLEDALASALVRTGIAAAADPSEAGALLTGGALDSGALVEVVVQHGRAGGGLTRVLMPTAAVLIGAGLGVLQNIGRPISGNAPTPAPVNTAMPAITGTAQEGQILTASTGSWSNSPTGYSYQWKRGSAAIAGSINAVRTLTSADVGAVMSCTITAINAGGSASVDTAGTVAVIAATATLPVNTVAPAVTGNALVGQTLTSDTGTWSNNPTSYAYAWRQDGVDISGATASTYIVASGDVGKNLTCRVFATNSGGTAGSISNAKLIVGSNAASPSGDRTIPLSSRVALPDGAYPATAGKGWPCTGIDLDADGTFWAGHGTAGDTTTAGIVQVNANFTQILTQITVTSMGVTNGSVQGVCIDDSDGTIFFNVVNTSTGKRTIVHCTKAGVLISATEYGTTLGGLAYDNQRDCLIALYSTGSVRWINKVTYATLSGVPSFTAAGSNNDQLFYDPTRKELLVSGGANGEAGTVDVYNVASAAQTLLATLTLNESLAIEGVARRGDDLITLCDQSTHPTSGSAYNYNQADFYVGAMTVTVSPPTFTVSNAAATEGQPASFTLTAQRNNTTGILSGTWTTLVGGSYSVTAADFNGSLPTGNWSIADGATTTTVAVTSFDDTDAEANETYGVQFNYSGSAVATGTGTINDNDAPAGTYDADSTALFNRMTVAPDATRKGKINDFVVSLKNAGLWAKMDAIYVMAAHDSQAALLNWKGTKANATLAGTTLPTFTANKGFATDGSSGYIDYGWAPSAGTNYTLNSACYGGWLNNNSAMSNGGACFSALGTTINLGLNARSSGNASAVRMNGTGAYATGATVTDCRGSFSCSRTAANALQVYRNGAPEGSAGTTASTSPLNDSNFSSGRQGASTYQLQSFGLAFMGAGLTASEHQALYTAVNTYMTAVGNQVV